jgi:hypothetical protein
VSAPAIAFLRADVFSLRLEGRHGRDGLWNDLLDHEDAGTTAMIRVEPANGATAAKRPTAASN